MVGTQFYAISITGTQPTNIPIAGTQPTSIRGLNPSAFQSPGLNPQAFQSPGQFSGITITGTQPTSIPIAGTKFQSLGLNSPAFQHWDSTHQNSNSRDSIQPAFQSPGLKPPAFQLLGLNSPVFQSVGLIHQHSNHWDSISPTFRHPIHRDAHLGIFFCVFGHGGELVAEVLKAHRVRELFTLCGGHISPILVACEQIVIRVLDMRHETTAVFAADAAARLR
ncbi:hypothetical protein niasHT_036125 [Heterodera trifolii]|uniref:Thiamine pyrophosphate enzyme N-terminal TPP-binding domain-containing protein n=1 Tax=Heterodera trifolii TaxID=157864 RepID=A0ABD2IDS3_9BILA